MNAKTSYRKQRINLIHVNWALYVYKYKLLVHAHEGRKA